MPAGDHWLLSIYLSIYLVYLWAMPYSHSGINDKTDYAPSPCLRGTTGCYLSIYCTCDPCHIPILASMIRLTTPPVHACWGLLAAIYLSIYCTCEPCHIPILASMIRLTTPPVHACGGLLAALYLSVCLCIYLSIYLLICVPVIHAIYPFWHQW